MAAIWLLEYDGICCLVDQKGKGVRREYALPLVISNRFLGERAQV